MSRGIKANQKFKDTARSWFQPQVLALLFLGFSAGVPILLIFSTLGLWLREAGVVRSAVTFFSWAALGYSFKFIWAPLVDLLPLPFLTRTLGRRRGWMLLSQIAVITAIFWMASINPANGGSFLTFMAFAAVMLGFSSATQDIVIDAYRIECAEESLQALLASMYIIGYRVGMIVAGAGSLFLADYFGSVPSDYSYSAWRSTYMIMAAVMGVGVVTTLVIKEPVLTNNSLNKHHYRVDEYLRFLAVFVMGVAAFATTFFYSGPVVDEMKTSVSGLVLLSGGIGGFLLEILRFGAAVLVAAAVAYINIKIGVASKVMVKRSYVEPVLDFFSRYGGRAALLLLLLVGFYRLSDIVLGVVSNIFYADIGFSKTVIAGVTKTFGLIMIIIGGLLGGLLTVRFGVYNILLLGACLSSATNLLFMILAQNGGGDITMLSIVIAADNLAAGIATTAFVAFLSSLTSISFTAMQYAIFSSVMTLFPKVIGGYSGTMVSSIGYPSFFMLTAVMGLPVILLILAVKKGVQASFD